MCQTAPGCILEQYANIVASDLSLNIWQTDLGDIPSALPSLSPAFWSSHRCPGDCLMLYFTAATDTPQAAATSFMETIRFSFNLCNVSLLNRFLIHIKTAIYRFCQYDFIIFRRFVIFICFIAAILCIFTLYCFVPRKTYRFPGVPYCALLFDFFRFFLKRFLHIFRHYDRIRQALAKKRRQCGSPDVLHPDA